MLLFTYQTINILYLHVFKTLYIYGKGICTLVLHFFIVHAYLFAFHFGP